MQYYDSMQALIGNTPLVRLGNIVKKQEIKIIYNFIGNIQE